MRADKYSTDSIYIHFHTCTSIHNYIHAYIHTKSHADNSLQLRCSQARGCVSFKPAPASCKHTTSSPRHQPAFSSRTRRDSGRLLCRSSVCLRVCCVCYMCISWCLPVRARATVAVCIHNIARHNTERMREMKPEAIIC
jgi:hypothetical protein